VAGKPRKRFPGILPYLLYLASAPSVSRAILTAPGFSPARIERK